MLDNIQITPLLDTLKLEKISDQIYFSEKYSGYISNSRLSLINPNQDNDPKAFFEGLSKHNKYSDALIFGSAVHELILQPELFKLVDCVDRPTAKLGFMADYLYTYFCNNKLSDDVIIKASDEINYYKGKMNKDKIEYIKNSCKKYWSDRSSFEWTFSGGEELIYLDPKSRERVYKCVEALNSNKSIQELLHPVGFLKDPISENEQAILLDVQVEVDNKEPFILRLKAKLDNYTIDFDSNIIAVNDIKTIGKVLSEFKSNFDKFRYCRELSLYSWLLSLCVSKFYDLDNPTIQANCLVISTIPNYYTKIYKLTKEDFKEGWEEFVYLLKLVAYYYDKGYMFS